MQVLYNGKFTAVSFRMAGVHMLGNPGLVIELFTSGKTWRWSFKCQLFILGNSVFCLEWFFRKHGQSFGE